MNDFYTGGFIAAKDDLLCNIQFLEYISLSPLPSKQIFLLNLISSIEKKAKNTFSFHSDEQSTWYVIYKFSEYVSNETPFYVVSTWSLKCLMDLQQVKQIFIIFSYS